MNAPFNQRPWLWAAGLLTGLGFLTALVGLILSLIPAATQAASSLGRSDPAGVFVMKAGLVGMASGLVGFGVLVVQRTWLEYRTHQRSTPPEDPSR